MRPRRLPIAALLSCALPACGGDSADRPLGPTAPVVVMTRNLYLGSEFGSELTDVLFGKDTAAVPPRVARIWDNVKRSEPAARMALIADEIVAARPDAIGVQEAVVFHAQTPSDFDFSAPVKNAGDPGAPGAVETVDFLQLLLDALAARDASYQVAVKGRYTDVELPATADDESLFDVRLIDHNVILVRAGVEIADPRHEIFASHLDIPVAGSATRFDLLRGFERAVLSLAGVRFTFAHTHLEISGGGSSFAFILNGVQEGQARNLITGLAGMPNPLVLVGDLNSSSSPTDTNSYEIIVKDGKFSDAWTQLAPADPGLTCCTDLDAATFDARSRIDVVFHRGRARADAVARVGVDPAVRTPGGRFPADHAGVVATLGVELP